MIVSGTKKINLIDTVRGTIIESYGHPDNDFIYSMAGLSENRIAFITEHVKLHIMSLPEFNSERMIKTEHKNVSFSLIRINDSVCVTGAFDNSVKVFNYLTGKCLASIQTESNVNSIKKYSDREVLVAMDGRICVYDIKNGKMTKEWLLTNKDPKSVNSDNYNFVYDIAVVIQKKVFIAAVYRSLRVYFHNKPRFLREIVGHSDIISFLKLLGDTSLRMISKKYQLDAKKSICLLSSSDDTSIKLWVFDNSKYRSRNVVSFRHDSKITWLTVLGDTRPSVFCSCGENREIRVWDMISSHMLRKIHHRDDVCTMMELSGSVVGARMIERRIHNFERMKRICVSTFMKIKVNETKFIRIPRWFLSLHAQVDFSDQIDEEKNSMDLSQSNFQYIDQELLLSIIYGVENREISQSIIKEIDNGNEKEMIMKIFEMFVFFDLFEMKEYMYLTCHFIRLFTTGYLNFILYKSHVLYETDDDESESEDDDDEEEKVMKFKNPITLAIFNELKNREEEVKKEKKYCKFLESLNYFLSFLNYEIQSLEDHPKLISYEEEEEEEEETEGENNNQSITHLPNSFQEIFDFNLERLFFTLENKFIEEEEEEEKIRRKQRILNTGNFVILASEGDQFFVHKDILCFKSRFLSQSIENEHIEIIKGKETMFMNHMSKGVLENLISFIYRGQFPSNKVLTIPSMFDILLNNDIVSEEDNKELKEYTLSQIDILMRDHFNENKFELRFLEIGHLIKKMDKKDMDEMLELWEGHFNKEVNSMVLMAKYSEDVNSTVENLKEENETLKFHIKGIKRKRGDDDESEDDDIDYDESNKPPRKIFKFNT